MKTNIKKDIFRHPFVAMEVNSLLFMVTLLLFEINFIIKKEEGIFNNTTTTNNNNQILR
jgi:hypothetical protein